MLTSIRGPVAATLCAGLCLFSASAHAQATDPEITSVSAPDAGFEILSAEHAGDEPSHTEAAYRAVAPFDQHTDSAIAGSAGLTISVNAALVTEYRFRGVNLSGGDPAVQGGVDIGHSSGFYVGAWASTLDDQTVGYGAVELDLFGGWTGPIADGLTADVGFIAYTYPDAPEGDFDYYEVYAALGFTLGPVSSTVGVAYDPEQDGLDFGGLTRDNLYLYTDVSVAIPSTPVTLNAHLGYTDGSLTFTDDSKSFDWSLGASVALGGPFTAGVAYIDAEQDVALGQFNPTSSTIVGTLSATF